MVWYVPHYVKIFITPEAQRPLLFSWTWGCCGNHIFCAYSDSRYGIFITFFEMCLKYIYLFNTCAVEECNFSVLNNSSTTLKTPDCVWFYTLQVSICCILSILFVFSNFNEQVTVWLKHNKRNIINKFQKCSCPNLFWNLYLMYTFID